MKMRSDEEEREERKRLRVKNESRDPQYDIVLMLSQPAFIEM